MSFTFVISVFGKVTPLKLGWAEWETRKLHLYVIYGTSDWNERQVFAADDNWYS
jgi:hypothetical protein